MGYVETAFGPDGVAVITLNDPERRNAMGQEMAAEFSAAVASLKKHAGLRAVVLTGAGTAFAAGGDLQMLKAKADKSVASNRYDMLEFYNDFLCILDIPVPLVAAMNGHAMGAGFCLALACDLRLAASNAKLGLTFTRLGLHPGMGATYFLPRIAGTAIAADLLITSRVITAEEARQSGMVSKVVDSPDQVLPEAMDMVGSILQCGPQSVSDVLETLRPNSEELATALQREAAMQARNYASPDFLEGVQAAMEQRDPEYRGTSTT